MKELEDLVGGREPYLIGVRHHSPVLAAAMPYLLEAARPRAVLVELPGELQEWLGWLGSPATTAPVALAVASQEGERLGFYPFADFSPELAAVRWAVGRGVPVHAIDLLTALPGDSSEGTLVPALMRQVDVDDHEELWDRLVETPSHGAEPARIRRAALAVGWALRQDVGTISERDLAREAWMRHRIADIGPEGAAVVVGAFHAPALTAFNSSAPALTAFDSTAPTPAPTSVVQEATAGEVVTALVPYGFELLDSRSGYPAGIKDPEWRQAVYLAEGDPAAVERAAAETIARICAELRRDGHVAGVPDAKAAYGMARDLAALRDLPAPGRRELVEALQSALAQGEPLGRARAVARAAERVLIGARRGQVDPAAPRSGLLTHVETLVADLGLPGPGQPEAVLRLDPHRSPLDQRRHLALSRLSALDVGYAEERPMTGVGGADTLGRSWTARWRPLTEATLERAAVYGTTLAHAAEGRLRRAALSERLPAIVEKAAECGLPELTAELVGRLGAEFIPVAGPADLVACHRLLCRLAALPSPPPGCHEAAELVLTAAVASVEGLSGMTRHEDAALLGELVRLAPVRGRLTWALRRMAADGTPLAQGAAAAALLVAGATTPASLSVRLATWAESASPTPVTKSLEPRPSAPPSPPNPKPPFSPAKTGTEAGPGAGVGVAGRVAGVVLVAGAMLEASAELLAPLAERVEVWDDAGFLARLPALRDGFEALSPASRQRLLDSLGLDADVTLHAPAEELAAWAAADEAGRLAVLELDPAALDPAVLRDPAALDGAAGGVADGAQPVGGAREGQGDARRIGRADRWRMVLGREADHMDPPARAVARALDDLYGAGTGEGADGGGGGGGGGAAPGGGGGGGGGLFVWGGVRGGGGPGGGGGRPYPSAREWVEELEALFGARVREEVVGRAAARGRVDALLALDPERVSADVGLLEGMLALAGALPEARLAKLRPLVARVVAELTEKLARRMRPALTGLTTPRPTLRPGGPIDLRRTLRRNLHTARLTERGPEVVVERPVFRTRARRGADWHLHLCVDVSGSMERSTIYAALAAAVLHGVPALSVRFITFSTEVADLSDRVADPLSLLLEVSVGGGTDIGTALRYTRERLTVPRRSIVAVVSDFDEGVSVGRLLSEVRALAGTGAHTLGLAALDDQGKPVYNRAVAEQVAAAGMPVAALSPSELAAWIAERVRG
ncbi:DUF5682 family protein [Nonomuraea endophytica]|uniref:DUF5682 family protein n=1 Tax=Nonomuraea endophytica TaxID=714136 RepID=UPI0037C5A305